MFVGKKEDVDKRISHFEMCRINSLKLQIIFNHISNSFEDVIENFVLIMQILDFVRIYIAHVI